MNSPKFKPPSLSFLDEEMEEMDEEHEVLLNLCVSNSNVLAYFAAQTEKSGRKGSIPGHIVINRGRIGGSTQLWNDYFSANPTFGEDKFRRRFRMRRPLFLRIVKAVKNHDNFFIQKKDALGRLGLSTLQKITAVLRVLAYGTPADSTDEYLRIGESTTILCVKRFCRAIVKVFGEKYLRSPNSTDIERLLKKGKERGFPGMLGSLDCMHWGWKNCPTAWAGQYTGRSGSPTMILEAMASYDLWIWHAYFGLPGSNNDINVLQSSNLFANLTQGIAPPAQYSIQGVEYHVGYYLTDGIYPKWSTLVQSISQPEDPKKKHYAIKQEECRKDVERAFGVLQSRFAIVKGPARFWNKHVLHDIMSACIIMHKMIIEDESYEVMNIEALTPTIIPNVDIVMDEAEKFQLFLARHKKLKNKEDHYALRNALVEHLWERLGNTPLG